MPQTLHLKTQLNTHHLTWKKKKKSDGNSQDSQQHTPKGKPFCTKTKSLFTWCSRNKKGLKFKLKGELKKQNKEKGSQQQCPQNLISSNGSPLASKPNPFFNNSSFKDFDFLFLFFCQRVIVVLYVRGTNLLFSLASCVTESAISSANYYS